jgi:hypothetical protein
MLKKILTVSGKPGLFRLLSQGKNMLIVEALADGKRQPVLAHEKVVSLGDIAIFTDDNEVPLHEVFTIIKEKNNGGKLTFDPKSTADASRTFFAEILPAFDRDRVYPSDIKKVALWYNQLIDNEITNFKPEEEKAKQTDKEQQ